MSDVFRLSTGPALDGLRLMMWAADDAEELVRTYVDASTALLIVEVAIRADDRPEWFPHGKWGTIHAIQERLTRHLDRWYGPDRLKGG